MKIYTKTGDKETTGLYDGSRVHKSSSIIEALGYLDSLSVAIAGIIVLEKSKEIELESKSLIDFLRELQSLLLDVGSIIASNGKQEITPEFKHAVIKELETNIDFMTENLPSLTKFILVGSGIEDVVVHNARVLCRQAEVKCCGLNLKDKHPHILQFLNRLSDFFFTLARYFVYFCCYEEIVKT